MERELLLIDGALISATGVCVTFILSGAALRNLSDQFNMMQYGMGPLASTLMGIIAGLISLVAGALGGLTFYAIGEGIYLLISIEENTRAAAQPLETSPVIPPVSEPAP